MYNIVIVAGKMGDEYDFRIKRKYPQVFYPTIVKIEHSRQPFSHLFVFVSKLRISTISFVKQPYFSFIQREIINFPLIKKIYEIKY